MSTDYMSSMIYRTRESIYGILNDAIDEYERLLMLNNKHDIVQWMKALSEQANRDQAWVGGVYTEVIRYDMYVSGATSFLSMIAVKIINLEKYKYLQFSNPDLIALFDALQSMSSAPSVDGESMELLGSQADKLLDKSSLEYRVIRVLCVSKVLSLYNICNVVAKLLVSQDAIKEVPKIKISPNINE